jgi:membrane protease YdiL (CAAX protease family)
VAGEPEDVFAHPPDAGAMAPEHGGRERDGWQGHLRSLAVAVALAVGGFLATLVVLSLLRVPLSAAGIGLQRPVGYATSTLVQGFTFGLVVLAYARYADLPGLLAVRWPSRARLGRTVRDLGWVLAGVLVLLGLAQVLGVVLGEFGISPGTNRVETLGRRDPVLFLYLIALSFVAIGPGEELLFRGGVQGVLRRSFPPASAVALSSALFGLAHVTAVVAGSGTDGVLGYVVAAVLLGVVLGTLYEHTDNLLIPVVVHGTYNAILFAVMYATTTGLFAS